MSAEPPPLPGRPILAQRWTDVAFVHWRYRPADVQQLLPRSVIVDTFDGSAWIGLVPFVMEGLRPVGLPALAHHRRFVEVNVRTYVRDRTGRPAVWFFSLDVPLPDIVAMARAGIGARYCLARASHASDGQRRSYSLARRWPGQPRAHAEIEIDVSRSPTEADPLLRFLTARWAALTTWCGRLLRSPVTHEPWPLASAEITRLDQTLVQAAGLTDPAGDPLVHFSPGVTATFSRPERLTS